MLLSIKNLTFGWQSEALFQNINGQLDRSEIVLLQGENGTGKTTLLKLIAGMIPHFSRGKILKGEILVNNRSITKYPPKSFFPQIAFIPTKNIDFFLLTGNLEQEIALVQAMLKIDFSKIKRKQGELQELFPEIGELWKTNFDRMTICQKILSLTSIYYFQEAHLFLFDEILDIVPDEDISLWMNFFQIQTQSGCGIIFVSHQMKPYTFPVWEIKGKTLPRTFITSIC